MNSDNSSDLEITISNKENLNLSAIDTACTCSFANPIYADYLKLNGQNILPASSRLFNVNSILQNSGVILYGGTEEERKIEREKIEKIIASLNVIDIPFPHPVLKTKVLEEGGTRIRDRYEGVCSFVPDDSSKITIVFDEKSKKNAHKFADDLRQEIDLLDFFEFSKSKSNSTLFRLDEPSLKHYASENNVSLKRGCNPKKPNASSIVWTANLFLKNTITNTKTEKSQRWNRSWQEILNLGMDFFGFWVATPLPPFRNMIFKGLVENFEDPFFLPFQLYVKAIR